MLKYQAVKKHITITKQGEVHHFQFVLPHEVAYIVGVEHCIRMLEVAPDPVAPGEDSVVETPSVNVIGQLRLHELGRANHFYAAELLEDKNVTIVPDFSDSSIIGTTQWANGHLKREETINLKQTAGIIKGHFTDNYGLLTGVAPHYEVSITLWCKQKEAVNDC